MDGWPTTDMPLPDPVVLTPEAYAQLLAWIRAGEGQRFYRMGLWASERAFVRAQDHGECWLCKSRGRHRRASLVHHIRHLTSRPDLALRMWVLEGGVWRRQLVALCDACHDAQHPERLRQYCKTIKPVSKERWD